jgi:hypothetical protein
MPRLRDASCAVDLVLTEATSWCNAKEKVKIEIRKEFLARKCLQTPRKTGVYLYHTTCYGSKTNRRGKAASSFRRMAAWTAAERVFACPPSANVPIIVACLRSATNGSGFDLKLSALCSARRSRSWLPRRPGPAARHFGRRVYSVHVGIRLQGRLSVAGSPNTARGDAVSNESAIVSGWPDRARQ